MIEKKRLIKILSIDGGGVRGIIPAYVLMHLEQLIDGVSRGKKIADCFDVIAGTSIGGILALKCALGDPIVDVWDSIFHNAPKIFSRTLFRKIITVNGLTGAKYDRNGLLSVLNDVGLKEQRLSDLKTNVIVPAYCISENRTYLFSKAHYSSHRVLDVALATSAAPTYFDPWTIPEKSNKQFIDGGVSVNNPTNIAISHARDLFGSDIDMLVVSLGTGTIYGYKRGYNASGGNGRDYSKLGKIGWAEEIIPIMLSSENSIADYEADKMLDPDDYYRFQALLDPKNFEIDDTSKNNMIELLSIAEVMTRRRMDDIERIAQVTSA